MFMLELIMVVVISVATKLKWGCIMGNTPAPAAVLLYFGIHLVSVSPVPVCRFTSLDPAPLVAVSLGYLELSD